MTMGYPIKQPVSNNMIARTQFQSFYPVVRPRIGNKEFGGKRERYFIDKSKSSEFWDVQDV